MPAADSLLARRQAAWKRLETEKGKLQRLTEEMQRLGVTPPGWDAQNAIVKAAQTEFELLDEAYLESLWPRRGTLR